MNLPVYSLLALPLWAALFALYFILRRAKLMKQSLIAKCAATFLAAGSAGLALYQTHPGLRVLMTRPVLWFFGLCLVADALLEISFVPGMLLFGAAHVCLILWLLELGHIALLSVIIWVISYALTAWLFRRELPTLGKLTVPFLLYPALLGTSLALGLALPITTGWDWWPLALGVLCFYVSDMMVAKGQLSNLSPAWEKPAMVLYWGALYLIAVPLWTI